MGRLKILERQLIQSLAPGTPLGTPVLGTLDMLLDNHAAAGEGILVPMQQKLLFFSGPNSHPFDYADEVSVTQQQRKRHFRADITDIFIKTYKRSGFFLNVTDGDVVTFCSQVNLRSII